MMRQTLLASAAIAALVLPAGLAPAQARTLGFIVSNFTHASHDGAEDCPDGLNTDARTYYLQHLPPAERAKYDSEEGKKVLGRILSRGANLLDRQTHNVCTTPTEFMGPEYLDPNFRTITHTGTAPGMNLDNDDGSGAAPANVCRHDNFTSPGGTKGIDNQWWRLMGCVKYYRPGGDIEKTALSIIRNGEVSIMLEVTGVDDMRNDPEVEVGFYSSSEPVQTDGSGAVMSGTSLMVHENKRFHAIARGRIENGVLTTEPADVHLQDKALIIDNEWFLKAARLRLEIAPDGTAKGMLAGYYDVETFYNYIRQSHVATSVNGGYTCPSLYLALHRLADGFPDAKTGECTAISTAFVLEAVPGFVIHPRTRTADAKP